MTTIDALALVLVLAVVATLFSGAGWLTTRATLRERDTRYVTIARLEAALAAQQQRHDEAMRVMDRRMAAAVARQDVLERDLDEEREKRRGDHALMAEMQRVIEAWMRYARQLAEIIRRELHIEPPPEPEATPGPAPRRPDNMRDLARRIAHAFSLSEMEELAADVFETDPEGILTGETLERRASSLVLAAARRDVSSRLVALCREKRPGGGF